MKQKQTKSILARVAPENEEMHGIFRLTASTQRVNISNICGEFRTDSNFRVLQIASIDDLFFYGLEKDFKPNFRTRSEADAVTKVLFPTHIEAHYSERTPQEERNGDGYARIPIKNMELDEDWDNLLREVLNHYSINLEPILKKRVKVKIPKENTTAYKSMLGQFKKFPSYLSNLALKSGFYYWIRKDDSFNYDRSLEPITGTVLQIPIKRFHLKPKTIQI